MGWVNHTPGREGLEVMHVHHFRGGLRERKHGDSEAEVETRQSLNSMEPVTRVELVTYALRMGADSAIQATSTMTANRLAIYGHYELKRFLDGL